MNSERETAGKAGRSEGSFEQLLNESMAAQTSISIGEKVQARVFNIGKEYVALDLGAREEGLLPRVEVEQDGEVTVKVGDTITVYTAAFRDGAVLCARRVGAMGSAEMSGDREAAQGALQDAYEQGLPVEGTVKEVIKGGFNVQVMGQRAFCPISQIADTFTNVPEEHLGHVYSFLITEFSGGGRNLVVSRRKLLEAEKAEQARNVWETLTVGAVLEGTVASIKSYGAFIELGGVQGLLHVSEIGYDRVDDPGEQLTVGQTVKVQIKGIDSERQRISLSRKALLEDPWLAAAQELKEGTVMTGKVVRLAQFGAFVELLRGVDGLVHISEMGGDRHLRTPHEAVRVGDEVQVKVLQVDPERRRISLSMNEASNEEGRGSALPDEDRPAPRERPEPKPKQSLGTFGELFAEKLKRKK